MKPLPAKHPELLDLAVGEPELHDLGQGGGGTGLRLKRLLGVGGMSAVFLAEVDPRRRTDASPRYPHRVALKIVKPWIMLDLQQEGIDARKLAEREATVLGRIMARVPPTDVVVGFYGQGDVQVDLGGRVMDLPWLALELVDGGPDGTSLTQRIARAPGGCDPVRVHRLARRIAEGVGILHAEGVIHRDLKPDNVLVTGPVGDETPKIADCGIARVNNTSFTFAACTQEYAGLEQWRLSQPGISNPLIGPWTDVHALAAVLWYIVAGENWCRGPGDKEFLVNGARRSLREGGRLHPGFAAERSALEALDAALARGASPALPEIALASSPERLRVAVKGLAPTKGAPPRYASIAALMADVLPVLEDLERRWRSRAAREGLASTILRTAQLPQEAMTVEPLAELIDVPGIGPTTSPLSPLEPGNVAFQPDGRALARFGDRLFYLGEERSTAIAVPSSEEAALAATRLVVRLPFGGFALVGPAHIRLVQPGRVVRARLPERAGGGAVGEIVAAVGDAYAFGVVTADVGEGGPELWLFRGETPAADSLVLPGLAQVNAVVSTPYGFLAVGGARAAQGSRGRAVFASEEGQPSVYMKGVIDKPPLLVALSSAERTAWAAGDGFVLGLDRGSVVVEDVATKDRPVAMGLDPMGVPWLVTRRAVMRRSLHGGTAAWRLFHEQDAGGAAFVGIGFSVNGARVVDAAGGGALLKPRDVESWRSAER